MRPAPLSRDALRRWWRELAASAATFSAISLGMIAGLALPRPDGLWLGTAFAFAGATYAATAVIPFQSRLRGALLVLAVAYVGNGVLLAREPFVFGIGLVLALALAFGAGGVYALVDAARRPARRGWMALAAAAGALAAAAGLVISLPDSARWALGPVFGAATLAHAAGLLRLARAGRALEQRPDPTADVRERPTAESAAI